MRAAYHRAEYLSERASLMQWWADFLDEARTGQDQHGRDGVESTNGMRQAAGGMRRMPCECLSVFAQAALARRSAFLKRWFGIPADRLVVCGISFGLADPGHPANRFRTPRAPLADVVRWVEE